jgi:hypothetical protein
MRPLVGLLSMMVNMYFTVAGNFTVMGNFTVIR